MSHLSVCLLVSFSLTLSLPTPSLFLFPFVSLSFFLSFFLPHSLFLPPSLLPPTAPSLARMCVCLFLSLSLSLSGPSQSLSPFVSLYFSFPPSLLFFASSPFSPLLHFLSVSLRLSLPHLSPLSLPTLPLVKINSETH